MPRPGFPSSGPPTAILLFASLLLLQVGCRPVRDVIAPAPVPSTRLPSDPEHTRLGYTRYRVVSEESEVRALVYRDGAMARLGHNHVLSSRSLRGEILVGGKDRVPRVSLVLPVASFAVDAAKARAEEGEDFSGVVDEDTIAGTRKNLLSEALLDAAHFPEIRLTSGSVTGQPPNYTMTVAVEVKGRTHALRVPVRVNQQATELEAIGVFTVTHTELGLTPFAVMGGLLSVRNEIRLRFRIVARP